HDLTRNLGFEGELGYVFDVVDDDNTVDWSLTNLSGSAIYHFDVKRVTPHATFGLGLEHSSTRALERRRRSKLTGAQHAVEHGGRLQLRRRCGVPAHPRFIARADLRRFEANDAAPDHWRFYGGLTFRIQ